MGGPGGLGLIGVLVQPISLRRIVGIARATTPASISTNASPTRPPPFVPVNASGGSGGSGAAGFSSSTSADFVSDDRHRDDPLVDDGVAGPHGCPEDDAGVRVRPLGERHHRADRQILDDPRRGVLRQGHHTFAQHAVGVGVGVVDEEEVLASDLACRRTGDLLGHAEPAEDRLGEILEIDLDRRDRWCST